MKWVNFLLEYVKSPRTVGAIAPSSKELAKKMVQDIDFSNADCIIEYGPGTGVFTEQIVKNKRKGTLLILFEYSKGFASELTQKYGNYDNILIINDSAENIDKHLKKYNIEKVDYIVSGLPFASLPKDSSNKILRLTRELLKREGLFITFQYTLLKKEYISSYFKHVKHEKVLYNLPPAYVLWCRND